MSLIPAFEIGVWNYWIPMVLFFLYIMLGSAFIITDIIEGIFKKHFPGKRWLTVFIFILLFISAFYWVGLSLSGHLEDSVINMQEYGKGVVWAGAGALAGTVIMLASGSILKYFQKRRWERSTRNNQHDEAIRLNPQDADAYYNRGLADKERGKKVEAIADFEKFISLTDNPEWIKMAKQQIEELSR